MGSAGAAASEPAELRERAGPNDEFRQVKALLGRALHPDSGRGAGEVEKIARMLLFKEIWPEIMRIDRNAH